MSAEPGVLVLSHSALMGHPAQPAHVVTDANIPINKPVSLPQEHTPAQELVKYNYPHEVASPTSTK